MEITNKILKIETNRKHFDNSQKGYKIDIDALNEITTKQAWNKLEFHLPTGRIYEISFNNLRQKAITLNETTILVKVQDMNLKAISSTKSIVIDEITHYNIKSAAKASKTTISNYLKCLMQ
jgi:hypothetical protein